MFQVQNSSSECTSINDGTLVLKEKRNGVWVHNPHALAYASIETKSVLENWEGDLADQGHRVLAQEGAEILGMMAQRVNCISFDETDNRSDVFLISSAQTYVSVKSVTFEHPYLKQFLTDSEEGARPNPEPTFPGWTKPERYYYPRLQIDSTPQMNLLSPEERLDAAAVILAVMEFLEAGAPLL